MLSWSALCVARLWHRQQPQQRQSTVQSLSDRCCRRQVSVWLDCVAIGRRKTGQNPTNPTERRQQVRANVFGRDNCKTRRRKSALSVLNCSIKPTPSESDIVCVRVWLHRFRFITRDCYAFMFWINKSIAITKRLRKQNVSTKYLAVLTMHIFYLYRQFKNQAKRSCQCPLQTKPSSPNSLISISSRKTRLAYFAKSHITRNQNIRNETATNWNYAKLLPPPDDVDDDMF